MSGGAPLPPSRMEEQKVHEVQFEIFKEKQIKDYAVCLIEHAKSYENGKAVYGGINDLRMGTTDFSVSCETCHRKHPECPGHFGYIELAEPMFNIGLFDTVSLVLKCVCKNCGALLFDKHNPQDMKYLNNFTGIMRLRQAAKMAKSICGAARDLGATGCGHKQPKIGRFQGIYPTLQIKATLEEQDMIWNADIARQVLDRVLDEDARIMGFNPERCHPRDLILTVLPVPPPQIRPAITFGSMRSDDELTHQIMAIMKRNIELKKAKGSDVNAAVDRCRSLLQESVAVYFNNASTYYKPTKVNDTKKLKSLTERLKGKYGRLRGNLMGKRVDFSARTVITGDPNIDVDEVGVPFSIAMTLTFPERVNTLNKKRLTEFVRRTVYPSANYVFHPNGTITKLALLKDRSTFTLNVGDLVERHVIDGDVVLFNRQPTLHRMSMMGHRVRVLNYNTFRLNLSCTTPYNADFDGDEMNLHVPQGLLTKAELIEMMMVPKNFVSPNKSAPCMGIVQDSLLGSYRITDKDTFLDKYFVQSVAMWLDLWELPIPAILKPRPLWTGKQVFSLILPEVNHPASPFPSPPFPNNDNQIMIQRGQLLVGAITKGVVGVAPGSLIHVIFNERGSDEVAKFINGVQRITAYFLYNFGFSVGVQDTVADADTLRQMNDVLLRTRENVEKIGAAASNLKLTRKAGMSLLQSFEADVNSALNKCREEAAKKALSNVRRTNSFKVMIEAGSKGTDLNICQIAVFVGQQNVAGSRIPFGFRRRTLPHFMLDDYGETSKGMANRGYVEGLKPHEFYFHTMAGREGLIDTAVKTSDTGYLQRKLVKALEDVHAAYDGTVRNANQELIQLIYGEDGLDGSRIEGNQQFLIPFLNDTEMENMYKYEYSENGANFNKIGGTYMNPTVKDLLLKDPNNFYPLHGEFEQLMLDREKARKILDLDEKAKFKINLPVNIGRLIQNARATMGTRSQVSNLSPVSIIQSVQKLEQDLIQLFPSHHKGFQGEFQNEISSQRIKNALTLFTIHLRQMLGSKRVLKEYKLNDKSFEYLIKEIRNKYQQSLITPGEIIGAIAAQSCGEPATQMTLNTFHNAGISSKNVTLGVPRLLELLNVSKNQRNASMAIALQGRWSEKQNAQHAQHCIEYCTLASITTTVQIIYDPDVESTVVIDDEEIIQMERAVRNEEIDSSTVSPFIARLILDMDMIYDKDLNTRDINSAIRQVNNGYIIESSMDNAKKTILRLRPKNIDGNGRDSVPALLKDIQELLSNVHLLGIPGVKKTLLKDTVVFINGENGALIPQKACLIDTEGTALKRTFVGVLFKGENFIDFTKTSSNKVPEVASILGIEAARRKILFELREAYLAYGLNINYRHYTILVDTMCQRGYLMAVSRTGINRSSMSGPIMRCSFEETVTVLMAAAAFGESDPIRGVSANLVLGNRARIGTGLFDLIFDMGCLKGAIPQETAVAPLGMPDMYHGITSVLNTSSQAFASNMHDATPSENDTVTLNNSVSAAIAPSEMNHLYGGAVKELSMVHQSQAYPGITLGDGASRRLGSSSYSVLSAGSAYAPVSMAPTESHPDSSIDASIMSSFHIQLSAPHLPSTYSLGGASVRGHEHDLGRRQATHTKDRQKSSVMGSASYGAIPSVTYTPLAHSREHSQRQPYQANFPYHADSASVPNSASYVPDVSVHRKDDFSPTEEQEEEP